MPEMSKIPVSFWTDYKSPDVNASPANEKAVKGAPRVPFRLLSPSKDVP